jgi:hypothetical protein
MYLPSMMLPSNEDSNATSLIPLAFAESSREQYNNLKQWGQEYGPLS